MKGRVLALKRINKDMKEITQFPIEGIGIAPLDNDGIIRSKYSSNDGIICWLLCSIIINIFR